MKSFRPYQRLRIITVEGAIANGDYILDGITVRIKDGYLNDTVDDEGKKLPAIETHDGSHVEFWKNGVLHAEEGPAIIDTHDRYEKWFYEGVEVPAA
ncbi:MAG: hypothetical protein HUK25_04225 [Treponema sp.]|nr:hypothetical protein [Treponema sp.]